MDIIEKIKQDIIKAEKKKEKTTMFHYQVLINAEEIKNYDPEEFCKLINMPVSFATEFRKMISLAQMMKNYHLRY